MKTYNWPPALPHMCGQTGFIHKTNIYHLIKSSARLGCLTDRLFALKAAARHHRQRDCLPNTKTQNTCGGRNTQTTSRAGFP